MAKIKGQLESAQLENLTTDPTNLPEGRAFVNTTESKAKIVVGATKRNVVTEDQAQTLTNKTINGSNNTITNIPANTAISGLLPKANGGSAQDNSSLNFPTSGTLATTSGVEVLTNKDIDGGTASNSSRITLPKNTTTNLTSLTRKQGTIFYDTTVNQIKYDDGATIQTVSSTSFTAPTIQSFTTGSGTYTPTSGSVRYIIVKMIGGGSGGNGGGSAGIGLAGAGGNTTFGAHTAGGGAAGTAGVIGNAGGTNTVGGGASIIINNRGNGGTAGTAQVTTQNTLSGSGGSGPFGGAGFGVTAGNTPIAGLANSGAGGGGGTTNGSTAGSNGGGGGAGGYLELLITSPSAVSYAIGSGGSGGTAGTSGTAGAAGGSGYICVTEYYQ